MILEVATLDVRPGRGPDFEQAFAEAEPIITSMPGHERHEMRRCLERPDRYVVAMAVLVAACAGAVERPPCADLDATLASASFIVVRTPRSGRPRHQSAARGGMLAHDRPRGGEPRGLHAGRVGGRRVPAATDGPPNRAGEMKILAPHGLRCR